MARRRASMREGPLAELFRATEAAQRQKEGEPGQGGSPEAPDADATVESAAPFEQVEPDADPAAPTSGGEESLAEPSAAASESRSAPAEVHEREAPREPEQPERPYARPAARPRRRPPAV